MKQLHLDDASYNIIEHVLTGIADTNHISDVEFIDVSMNKNAGIIHYARKRPGEPALSQVMGVLTLAAISGISGGATKLFSSQTTNDIIKNIVDELIADPEKGIRGVDAQEWVDYIKQILAEGSKIVTAEVAKQERDKAKANQRTQDYFKVDKLSSNEYEELDRIYKLAMKGIGGRTFDWAKTKGRNFYTHLKNFVVGAGLDNLIDQLVYSATQEGYINQNGESTLKEYIKKSLEAGLNKLHSDITESEKQSEGEEQETAEAQPATSASPVVEPAPAASPAAPATAKSTAPAAEAKKAPVAKQPAYTQVRQLLRDPAEVNKMMEQFDAYQKFYPNLTDKQIFEAMIKNHIMNQKAQTLQ